MNDKQIIRIPVDVHPPDEPIDPYGKKKGYQSWQATIRRISQMTADELSSTYSVAIADLSKYGSITLRELAIIAVFRELIEHPNPSLLNLIMERDEGKVPNMVVSATGNVSDWMEYAKEQGIEIEEVMAEAKRIMEEYEAPPKVVEGEIVDT